MNSPLGAWVGRNVIEREGLVEEIFVIDDGSTDATAQVAEDAGARVVAESSILHDLPSGTGKGNALWKSLYACRGEIICWPDPDRRNIDAGFITGHVRPLPYATPDRDPTAH